MFNDEIIKALESTIDCKCECLTSRPWQSVTFDGFMINIKVITDLLIDEVRAALRKIKGESYTIIDISIPIHKKGEGFIVYINYVYEKDLT